MVFTGTLAAINAAFDAGVEYAQQFENGTGDDLIVVEVSDGSLTDTADITIHIEPVNDAPLAWDDYGDLVEDFGEIRQRRVVHRVAELLDRRLMRPGTLRTEIGDLQIILEGECRRHDLAVDRADRLFRQAAAVALDQPPQQRFLALRGVDLQAVALFHFAHLVDQVGAGGEEIEELAVDVVDE